jgi:exodeoxyribonuclease VII large subunit
MEEQRKIYSVAELNRTARFTLENGIGEVWVEGEISRMTHQASGHWYFTLKDAEAAVSCAMFKQNNASVTFAPKDGLKVRVLGQASLYEPRGSYQLIIRKMEEAGKGSLQEQFEKLKAKLASEGLFDADRKKPLPLLPQKIGVVTSPTGAAIRDIINVLTRRLPNLGILLAPVPVQGEGAAEKIAAAIDYLNTRDDIDLMIVGRGGGSIEDLWAFNEEIVARAIAASRIPVISAVGHEIDFTISDFVADVRAPTPSAAAELAVPVKSELEIKIARLAARLGGSLQNQVHVLRERIPGFHQTMVQSLRAGLRQRQQRVDEATLRSSHQLQRAVAERRQDIKRLEAQLRALSPLAVLDRGYSLTQTADGTVVRDAARLKKGDSLKTRFAKGTVISEVKEKES